MCVSLACFTLDWYRRPGDRQRFTLLEIPSNVDMEVGLGGVFLRASELSTNFGSAKKNGRSVPVAIFKSSGCFDWICRNMEKPSWANGVNDCLAMGFQLPLYCHHLPTRGTCLLEHIYYCIQHLRNMESSTNSKT